MRKIYERGVREAEGKKLSSRLLHIPFHHLLLLPLNLHIPIDPLLSPRPAASSNRTSAFIQSFVYLLIQSVAFLILEPTKQVPVLFLLFRLNIYLDLMS